MATGTSAWATDAFAWRAFVAIASWIPKIKDTWPLDTFYPSNKFTPIALVRIFTRIKSEAKFLKQLATNPFLSRLNESCRKLLERTLESDEKDSDYLLPQIDDVIGESDIGWALVDKQLVTREEAESQLVHQSIKNVSNDGD